MPSPLHYWLAIALLVLSSNFTFGQSTTNDALNCGTDELRSLRDLTDPTSRLLEDKLEQEWSDHVHSPRRSMPPPYTLPIVFHIVHNNGAENIDDEDILRSLDFTNQAFANTDYYDQGTGAPTSIQFCLARRAPDNQATTGINRLVSAQYTDLEAPDEDRDMKDLLRWEPDDYINVYIVKEICGLGSGCGVAGYAYYPSAHGGRVDGIVMEARWLNDDEADVGVLIHELGHYLGVRHTFDGGCINDDCTTDGDRVCDTPPDQSKVAVPCTGSVNSCDTDTDSGFATDQNDMFINYMDYGYFSCYSAFTQGQVDRMHFFLEGIRASLLDSPGCLDPCPDPITADFTGGDITVEAGTTVNFINTSINGTTYLWRVNDAAEATTTDFSRLFDDEGIFTVKLVANGTPPLCIPSEITQRIRVTCSLTAAFDPTGPTFAGEPRTFPNLSTLATQYRWRLDNITISNDEELTYTFPSPGLFNLCLRAENDYCQEDFCRLVFVGTPPDTTGGGPDVPIDTCYSSFQYAYQSSFGDEIEGVFSTVIPDDIGGFYAAGSVNRVPLVMHLSREGEIMWQVNLYPPGSSASVTEMFLDNEGQLAGIGFTTGNSFVFRIDPQSGNLLWGRTLDVEGASVSFVNITQMDSGGPYHLTGEATNQQWQTLRTTLLRLDPLTGDAVGDVALYDNENDISLIPYDVLRNQTTGDNYFLADGIFDFKFFLETNAAGTPIRQTEFAYDGAISGGSGVLRQDGNTVVALLMNSDLTTNIFSVNLYRFVPGMGLSDAFRYSLPESIFSPTFVVNDLGYLILGTTAAQPFLMQIGRNGEVLWARSYDLAVNGINGDEALKVTDDGGILLALSVSQGGANLRPTVIKLNADGTSANDCVASAPIEVEEAVPDVTSAQREVRVENVPLTQQAFGWEPANLEPAGGNCREECEDPVFTNCNAPFFLTFDEGDAVNNGTFTAVTRSNNLIYSGGRVNELPYIQAVQPDGEIRWQKYLQLEQGFQQGEYTINEMIIDGEGMLAGVGYISRQDIDVGGFAFRLDPLTGEQDWSFELNQVPGTVFNFVSLLEDLQGNYLVTGNSPGAGTIVGTRGFVIEIDPATGDFDLANSRYYHNDLDQGFVQSILSADGQTIYALGNSADSTRMILTAIDEPSKDVLWSRSYNTSGLNFNSLYGKSLLEHEGSLFIACSWRFALSDFYLVRLSLSGEIEAAVLTIQFTECLGQSLPLTVWNDRIVWTTDRFGVGTCIYSVDPSLVATTAIRYLVDGFVDSQPSPTSQNITSQNDLLHIATSSLGMPTLIAMNAEGEVGGDCLTDPIIIEPILILPLTVNTETIQQVPVLDVGGAFPSAMQVVDAGLLLGAPSCLQDCEIEEEEDNDCSTPFAFTFGGEGEFSNAELTAITVYKGIIYSGGEVGRRPYLQAVLPDGEILWQKTLLSTAVLPQESYVISELLIDTEGMLVGIGSKIRDEQAAGGFAFRLDPATGTSTWNFEQVLNQQTVHNFVSLMEGPNGNYLLTGNSPTPNSLTSSRGFVLEIDRATGTLLPDASNYYFDNLEQGFVKAILGEDGQTIYALGNDFTGLTMSVTAINAVSKSVEWSREYSTEIGTLPSISGKSLIEHNGDLFVSCSRFPNSSSLYLARLSLFGEVEAAVRVTQVPGSSFSSQPLTVWDGQITYSTEGFCIYSFEPDLTASTATLRNVSGPFILTPPPGTQYITSNNELLYLVGRISAGSEPGILAIDSNNSSIGSTDGFCASANIPTELIDQFGITINDQIIDQVQVTSIAETPTLNMIDSPINLTIGELFCPQNCDPTEICANGIDDDLDGLVDCEDPDLATDCCCTEGPTPRWGHDTVRCLPHQIDVFLSAGERLILLGPNDVVGDTILESQTIILSGSGIYEFTRLDSCGRTASDTLTSDPRARPTLDIGPDVTACSNAVVPLRAQDGFDTYEWVDGSSERRFTAYEPGIYWVIATDSCGEQQTDSMTVSIDPVTAIDLGPDRLICPGDTVTFSLNGFTDYQWSQSSFIDCTNCPTVRFAPDQDTLLLVAAQEGPGCFASDSIRIRIADLMGVSTDSDLCTGDTLSLDGQQITTAGIYSFETAVGDCFRTDTLRVRMLSDTTLRDTISLCANDSIFLFGNFESTADTYTQVLQRANGCDSTTVVELSVRGNLSSSETLQICRGDSILIFGQFEFESGVFQRSFIGSGGCDSVHQVTLEVNGAVLETEVFTDDCGGANAGAGEVRIIAGVGPFDVRWSTGDVAPQITGLAAGTYTVTVTNAEGCAVTDSLVVQERPIPAINLTALPETCPGDNDGSLTITGELSGQTFSLNDTTFSEGAFYPNLAPGNYVLSVRDSLGCDQSFPFTIATATDFFLDLPDDTFLQFGDSITFTPLTNAASTASLQWTLNGNPFCDGCPTLTIRPETTVTIVATLPDTSGCPVTDETTVRVVRENLFYVPNAFSPNGDGVNDVFRVYPGSGVDEVLRLAVYDRWGNEVFLREAFLPTDALAGWDGTRPGGRNPSVGVYVYTLELRLFNNRVISVAGEVMVMR